MLKKQMETIIRQLEKQNLELKKTNEAHLDAIEKATNYGSRLERQIKELSSNHAKDEDVWVKKNKVLEKKLNDISLICETHLRTNYPTEQKCIIVDNQPQYIQEREENSDSRLISEVIEKCMIGSDKIDSFYRGMY